MEVKAKMKMNKRLKVKFKQMLLNNIFFDTKLNSNQIINETLKTTLIQVENDT